MNTDMATVVRAMARPDSGLEIRDRMWLKITIPNAFIGNHVYNYSAVISQSKASNKLLKLCQWFSDNEQLLLLIPTIEVDKVPSRNENVLQM